MFAAPVDVRGKDTVMKHSTDTVAVLVVPSPMTRRFAERINAIEGLRLSPEMDALLEQFEAQELSIDERRERVLAEFRHKYR